MKKFVLVGILAMAFFAGCSQTQQPDNLDTFAQCLTENWATMYWSKTCPHCLEQKEMFGDSFQYIDYVECTEEFERCANLRGVPAREFSDGSIVEWRQALETLATLTNCKLK